MFISIRSNYKKWYSLILFLSLVFTGTAFCKQMPKSNIKKGELKAKIKKNFQTIIKIHDVKQDSIFPVKVAVDYLLNKGEIDTTNNASELENLVTYSVLYWDSTNGKRTYLYVFQYGDNHSKNYVLGIDSNKQYHIISLENANTFLTEYSDYMLKSKAEQYDAYSVLMNIMNKYFQEKHRVRLTKNNLILSINLPTR